MEKLIKASRFSYGMCIASFGIQQFLYGDFRPAILPAWPVWLHASPFWAYLSGAALIIASIFIFLEKKSRTVFLLLGGSFLILFIGFHSIHILFFNIYSPRHLGLWINALKELALSGGAFVMAGSIAEKKSDSRKKNYLVALLEKLIPVGRIFFSIMLIEFGLSHFYYIETVSGLVPAWIPNPVFWSYFAAVALIGSGIAIILKIKLKLVGLLLATMLFLWVILLHIPRAIAYPYLEKGNEITSVFEALAFCGIAIVISNIQKTKPTK